VVNFKLKGKIEAKENGVDYMIKQFGNEVLVYAFDGKEHAVECNFIELREAMKSNMSESMPEKKRATFHELTTRQSLAK
jgi:hypothetical protein